MARDRGTSLLDLGPAARAQAVRQILEDELRRAALKGTVAKPKRLNKFHAEPVVIDGHKFASRAEGNRYCDLRSELLGRLITDLKLHPSWPLHGTDGSVISKMTADFSYRRNGQFVVEDVKATPTKTRSYVIRKKMLKAEYGIEIVEVMR